MAKIRSLIENQHIMIDAHHRGKSMVWDWEPGKAPDDIHLDKTMNKKVDGMYVKVRVSLNNDCSIVEPKKKEKNSPKWIAAYKHVVEEVENVLKNDDKARKQLVEDVVENIKIIGPNKERRAIRKALDRLATRFGLTQDTLLKYCEFEKGYANLYLDDGKNYYVGLGHDDNYYLGEGDGRDFSRRVRMTKQND